MSTNPNSTDTEMGPQYQGDNAFAARMRLHQSWYRVGVLGVPCGTGPTPSSTRRLGSMLRRKEGAQGLNFLTPAIFQVAQRRIAAGKGTVEPFRLLHNMLSSQPMCFNLFGPLVDDLDLATTLWQALLPGEVKQVTRVLIEYAPEPAAEYLNDRTAFDAFVEYLDTADRSAFTGIEVKLSEPLSQQRYDGPAYRRWMEGSDSPWRPEARDQVAEKSYNQLWRDHLLAISMINHRDSQFHHGRLMLVRHPGDHHCLSVVQGYQDLLTEDDDTFIDMPLDRLVEAWEGIPLADGLHDWLARFRLRYLNLAAGKREKG